MKVTITARLHDFLHGRRILAEIAQRLGKKFSTLASELNPTASYAKFGVDDLLPLCAAVREMGFGDELDAILHEYFEALKTDNHPHRSPQDLSSMVLELIDNTATLANMASKLHGSTDVSELRNVQALIRQHLIPTALKLSANIDTKLGSDPSIKLALAK